MTAPAVVQTTRVDAAAPHAAVSPATFELETTGMMNEAKKSVGYVRVIVESIGKRVVGVNPSVTSTDVLKAMRSAGSMTNVKAETCE
jgi:hypothetical protein